jgi:hypothetical protein
VYDPRGGLPRVTEDDVAGRGADGDVPGPRPGDHRAG